MSTTYATDAVTPNPNAAGAYTGKQATATLTSTDTNLNGHDIPLVATLPAGTDVPAAVAADVTLQATNAVLGAVSDALAAAGGTGTASAKLRRVTQGLEDLKTQIVLAAGTAVIGQVTANAGTNLNTSLLALESGGNLAALAAVLGGVTDAIVAAGATGSTSAKLRRVTQGLEDLKTAIVLAASSAIIGKVGIDQTTPGTTNLVQAKVTYTPVVPSTTALTANQDNTVAFGQQVKTVRVVNNTTLPITVSLDVAATVGGLVPVPANGGTYFDDMLCTNLHIWPTGGATVNGTASGGISVWGGV